MTESIEKNNGEVKRSREDIESELTVLYKEQKSAYAQQRSNEEIMEIGRKFLEKRVELESKSVGGSWDEVKARLEKEMWDKIYEKREKESGHDRLAA